MPTLSQILPDGAEGGKEFGRVIDLLLINEWRIEGLKFQPLDDSAGDFRGLDSFSYGRRGGKITGYQYKFYKSPLSSQHRALISATIQQSAERADNKISTYVIVTPDDLTNSGRRQDKGDVEWFEDLREKYKSRFQLEHIGHTKIVSMFLRSRYLSLFYYPSLVNDGEVRRKSIDDTRAQYDQNMRRRFGRIEFVGMSVYKEEASRRVPLEKIYIPLSLVSETAPEESDETPRIEPTTLLAPGKRSVILGDPGSGKSTLLSFLSLVGITPSLQERCSGAAADDRLPIVVTLRRYADEIKARSNLSLIDYIVESTTADFNLFSVSKEFFEAYIESGRAIIFFDGLDELPGPQYKTLMRKRIDSFCSNFPLNTTVITSRIVGYEAGIRFDGPYQHFRLAKLRLSEIESFVSDWYGERIPDEGERQRNIGDLIKVIRNPDNDAIRDLSRNPLILTIVTLVHRIDAVLPDQRVVLYQKCTETLLNTWHKAKKQDDEPVKGRIEQRNRLRVEAIAYWMHRNSLNNKSRAVARHDDIVSFLTDHIEKEKKRDRDEPAEDQAEEFFNFVKSSAGLLIEAGDGLYSFIHLTFQEYLSATHLTTQGEVGGAEAIWKELDGDLQNPRWREVVRLLIASLKSSAAQAFFVERLCSTNAQAQSLDCTLLLIGLLRDGIEPAEDKADEILSQALEFLLRASAADEIRAVVAALKSWISKAGENLDAARSVFAKLLFDAKSSDKLALVLISQAAELGPVENGVAVFADVGADSLVLQSLVFGPSATAPASAMWGELYLKQTIDAFSNPDANAASAIGFGISALLDPVDVAHRMLSRSFSLLSSLGLGPHTDYTMNMIALVGGAAVLHPSLRNALAYCIEHNVSHEERVDRQARVTDFFSKWQANADIEAPAREQTLSGAIQARLRGFYKQPRSRPAIPEAKNPPRKRAREMTMIKRSLRKVSVDADVYSRLILASDVMRQNVVPSLVKEMGLAPAAHWEETLRVTLSRFVPEIIGRHFDIRQWEALLERLVERTMSADDLNWTAWLVLLDVWIRSHCTAELDVETGLENIIAVSKELDHGPLRFAMLFRDAYLGNPDAANEAKALFDETGSLARQMLLSAGWPDYSKSSVSATVGLEVTPSRG